MRTEAQDEKIISLEDDTAFSERIHREARRNRKNIGVLEGRISAGAGGGLLLLGLITRKRLGLALSLASAGGYLLYRGLTRRDPVYRLLSLNTETQGDQGRIEVVRTIVIERPATEIYGYWRNLDRLPLFMRHLASVREIDGQRSHWQAIAPAGTTVEWDAEIVQDLPGERLSWHSLPDSEVMNSGVVHFRDLGNGATAVQVFISYAPPAGVIGAGVAKLLGAEPGQQIEEDLQRLKDLLESTDQVDDTTMEDRLAASAADDAVEEIDSATRP
jgi:uncharacterized membrane protein